MIQTKKGSGGAIIVVMLLAVLVIGLGVTIYFLNKGGYLTGTPESVTETNNFSMILETRDSITQQSIRANYQLLEGENIHSAEDSIQKGELRELKIKPTPISIACWSEDYYLNLIEHIPSSLQLQEGKSKANCDMDKIEKNPSITHTEILIQGQNDIVLNISTKDNFNKITICPAWSSGFISVKLDQSSVTCDVGAWRNYTIYNDSIKDYNYLPEGQYLCGADIRENCESIQGASCILSETSIPSRLKNKVDFCQYLGKSIVNESLSIPMQVETSNYITRNDHIDFYIFDQDLRYDPSQLAFIFQSEVEGKDIGSSDIIYTIDYEGDL